MKTTRLLLLALPCLLALVVSVGTARADFTAKTAHEFMAAQTSVYKSGTARSVEKFVAFLSEDIRDIHVAYGREFKGKDFYRKNMPRKAKALAFYDRRVRQVTLGTNVAIIVFDEHSKEKKSDGRIKEYRGRTILVVDFNDKGLVTQMRRYQD